MSANPVDDAIAAVEAAATGRLLLSYLPPGAAAELFALVSYLPVGTEIKLIVQLANTRVELRKTS